MAERAVLRQEKVCVIKSADYRPTSSLAASASSRNTDKASPPGNSWFPGRHTDDHRPDPSSKRNGGSSWFDPSSPPRSAVAVVKADIACTRLLPPQVVLPSPVIGKGSLEL